MLRKILNIRLANRMSREFSRRALLLLHFYRCNNTREFRLCKACIEDPMDTNAGIKKPKCKTRDM